MVRNMAGTLSRTGESRQRLLPAARSSTDAVLPRPSKGRSRERTDRRPGGQPEHPGATLRQVEQADAVTVHRVERCRCGAALADEPVVDWEQPVQYGCRLQAIATYLKNYGLLPYQRTAEPFEDLFSIPISVGTLVNINDLCGQRVAGINETIRAAISGQPVVGFDETGMSINGKLQWLHVASTKATSATTAAMGCATRIICAI